MLVHSGVSASAAPPAAASRTSASVTARLAAGSSPEQSWISAARIAPQPSASSGSSLPARSSAYISSKPPTWLLADEDLRHGALAAWRAGSSPARRDGSAATSISAKATPLSREQPLGRQAVAAERRGVERDGLHGCNYRPSESSKATRASASTSTPRRAGRAQAVGAGRERGAGGQHVVDEEHAPPGERAARAGD